jgi:hypothetical protein
MVPAVPPIGACVELLLCGRRIRGRVAFILEGWVYWATGEGPRATRPELLREVDP